MKVQYHVGIDMAKDSFDAAIQAGGRVNRGHFKNGVQGFHQFHQWLRKHDVREATMWMEATGRYHEALATWFCERNFMVMVANPKAVRDFAKSRMNHHKTDSADALILLEFGESNPKKVSKWKPKTTARLELRDIMLEIDGLQKMVGQERNRLKCGLYAPFVAEVIKEHMAYLKGRIEILRNKAIDLINEDAVLSTVYERLLSMKGIGVVTAVILVAKIDFADFSNGRQLVKYAGVDPTEWRSGTSVKRNTRISRQGHSSIRTALFYPALAAIRHDPETKAFAKSMEERGKQKMVIVCAVMARMLRTAYALVRDERNYTANFN